MGVFDRQIASALRLIKKNGMKCTYHSVQAIPDSPQEWNGDDPITATYEVDMVFIPVDRVDRDTQVYREYQDVPLNFTQCYIPIVPFVPKLKDYFFRDGKQYNVQRVVEYKPNNEVIAYMLEVMA